MVATIIPLSVFTILTASITAYFDACGILDSTVVYIIITVYGVGAWWLWPHETAWRVASTTSLYQNKEVINHQIDSTYEQYESNFGKESRDTNAASHTQLYEKRKTNYASMVTNFYDLVTDFYEYGWGQSFHFGPRLIGEGFQESLKRCEYYLALRLGMNASHHVVDLGCGVGGPQRNIAHFTGSHITGINVNEYQIKVGTKYNQQQGLEKKCDYIKADFMHIPVKDNTYDHAYAIEATCHAPDKVACFSEAYRIIKPGGMFACLEWCVTPQFDSKNPHHVRIKQGIEVGNGVPALLSFDEILDGARKAGFEIIDALDLERTGHSKYEIPWYDSLVGKYTTLTGFRMSYIGRNVTHAFVTCLETLGIAPKGSTKVSAMLNATALDLVEGGKLEIFTPSYFFLARKPFTSKTQ